MRDKGLVGKLIEFYVFGNLPNSYACPDMVYGDIKTTHFKKLRNGGWNAKERVTLANIGNTDIGHYSEMKHLPLYPKLRKGVLFILHRHPIYVSFWDEKLIDIVMYDLETFPPLQQQIISADFGVISRCFRENMLTQKGQLYMHLHKHGGKGSSARAMGFTIFRNSD